MLTTGVVVKRHFDIIKNEGEYETIGHFDIITCPMCARFYVNTF
jgi:hypothetical protein